MPPGASTPVSGQPQRQKTLQNIDGSSPVKQRGSPQTSSACSSPSLSLQRHSGSQRASPHASVAWRTYSKPASEAGQPLAEASESVEQDEALSTLTGMKEKIARHLEAMKGIASDPQAVDEVWEAHPAHAHARQAGSEDASQHIAACRASFRSFHSAISAYDFTLLPEQTSWTSGDCTAKNTEQDSAPSAANAEQHSTEKEEWEEQLQACQRQLQDFQQAAADYRELESFKTRLQAFREGTSDARDDISVCRARLEAFRGAVEANPDDLQKLDVRPFVALRVGGPKKGRGSEKDARSAAIERSAKNGLFHYRGRYPSYPVRPRGDWRAPW
mmetsp:Transcript_11002/g.19929  ORF Transcript_11002/g.19929 Transcript_11002/m.19929 type:complete len:330 (+) Transcript_11002:78-1067(+)